MHNAVPLKIGGICLSQPAKWEKIIWGGVVPFLILVKMAFNAFPRTTAIGEVTFYSAVAFLIFYFFRYRDWSALKTPLAWPVALFTGWALIGLFFALDIRASLHDIVFHILKYTLLFLILAIFFNSHKKFRLLFWVIIVSVVISGLQDMYSFYVTGENTLLTRMTIANHPLPVPLGFMSLFSLALIAYLLRTGEGPWGKCVLALCSGGLLLIIFATQMRSIIVALPFVAIALFWDNKKLLSAAVFVLILGIFLFSTQLRSFQNSVSNTDRLTINYISLLLIKDHPVMGIGFSMNTPGNKSLIDHDALRAQVPQAWRNYVTDYNDPHNLWLGVAVQSGLPGLLFLLFLFVQAGRMCLAGIRQKENRDLRMTAQLCLSLLLLFSIYGLFNTVLMHLLETLLCVLFAMIAVIYGETRKSINSEGQNQVCCGG